MYIIIIFKLYSFFLQKNDKNVNFKNNSKLHKIKINEFSI